MDAFLQEGLQPARSVDEALLHAGYGPCRYPSQQADALTAEEVDGPEVRPASGLSGGSRATYRLDLGETDTDVEISDKNSVADELRELAAKGLCTPLWRTIHPVQQGAAEADVHSLQTGWICYNGAEKAERGNMWLATASAQAQAMCPSAGGMRPLSPCGLPPSHPSSPLSAPPTYLGGADAATALCDRMGWPGTQSSRTLDANAGLVALDGCEAPPEQCASAPPERALSPLARPPQASPRAAHTDGSAGLGPAPAPLWPTPRLRAWREGEDEASGAMSSTGDCCGSPSASHSRTLGPQPSSLDGLRGAGGLRPPPSAAGLFLPERVMMAITTAPAAFAAPACINKSFAPPFAVRVGVVAAVPMQIKATMCAYVLHKDQARPQRPVAALRSWHPSQHVVTEALGGGLVTQTLTVRGGSSVPPGLGPARHQGVADFVFSDLKFCVSSRMKPRWLVFALTLPTLDVLFAQYTVPTILMSRQCDQQSKALAILRGQPLARKRCRSSDEASRPSYLAPSGTGVAPAGPFSAAAPPPRPFSGCQSCPTGGLDSILSQVAGPGPGPAISGPCTMTAPQAALPEEPPPQAWPAEGPYTYERWLDVLERTYRHAALLRALAPGDVQELAALAGFQGLDCPAPLLPLSGERWRAFGTWFMSYMRLFRAEITMWAMRGPTAICGFSVGRGLAEMLLAPHPAGTFLVRPSLSLAGTLVLSLSTGVGVRHVALGPEQLNSRPLEVWVRDCPDAVLLLDVDSGARVAADRVFLLHYRRFRPGAIAGLLTGGGASPGPLPGLGSGCGGELGGHGGSLDDTSDISAGTNLFGSGRLPLGAPRFSSMPIDYGSGGPLDSAALRASFVMLSDSLCGRYS